MLHLFSSLIYYPFYYLVGYRKKVVRNNLINSFPDKSKAEIIKIEKSYFRYFIDLVVEIIKLYSISEKALLKRVKFVNLGELKAYLDNGQSVLVCSGHSCNWEMIIIAFGVHAKHGVHIIYKKLNNQLFNNWFNQVRSRFGNKMVEMKQTMRAVVKTKNSTTVFAFASDQTPVKEHVKYTLRFLNQPTAVLLGLEKVAQQTNRPVFYLDYKRIKRGYYEVHIIPLALNPKETAKYEIIDSFFEILEKTIKREPALWLWSHRRWKLNT